MCVDQVLVQSRVTVRQQPPNESQSTARANDFPQSQASSQTTQQACKFTDLCFLSVLVGRTFDQKH